jgi:PAS domain S-box-containing protein
VLDSVRQILLKKNTLSKQQGLVHCASGEQKLISWSVDYDLYIPNFATWWVGEDISQREQALKQLRKNEQQLRLLIENMPIMLLAFDKQAKIVMWNRQCEVVTGYSANVVLNNPDALAMLYPQMEYRFYRENPLHRSIGSHWEMELRCVDSSHKIIAWSDASQQMQVAGWEKWLLGEDITLRKRKQQAVSDSHALLSAAMEYLETGVLISDAQQRIVYSNHALNHLHGYEIGNLLDSTLSKIMPSASQGFVYKHYFSFLNGAHGEYYKEITEATHQNNSTFLVQTDVYRFAEYKEQNFVIWFIRALRPQNFP